MSVNKVPYSSEKIGMLKQLLINNAESGNPIYYEIRVDGLKVVLRTNDPEQFDKYEDFIEPGTLSVTVVLYEGTSRNNTRHIFIMKDEPKADAKPLSGIEINKMVDAKVEEVKKQMKQEQVVKENKDLKEELGEAYEAIEKLKNKITDIQNKSGIDSINWGKFAGGMTDSIIRKNAHLLAKIPGGEGLAGVLMEDNEKQEQVSEEEEREEQEATFTKKKDEEQLSEADKDRLGFMRGLEERFNHKEDLLSSAIDVLVILADKPEAIEQTKAFAAQYLEKPVEKKEEKPKESQPPKQTQEVKAEEKKTDEQNTLSDNFEEDNPSNILAAC